MQSANYDPPENKITLIQFWLLLHFVTCAVFCRFFRVVVYTRMLFALLLLSLSVPSLLWLSFITVVVL